MAKGDDVGSTRALQMLIDILQVMHRSRGATSPEKQYQEEQQKQAEVSEASQSSEQLPEELPASSLENSSEQCEKEVSAEVTASGANGTVEAPLQSGKHRGAKRQIYSEADLKFIYSKLCLLVDKSVTPVECVMIAHRRSELDLLVQLIKPVAIEDFVTATYICSFFSNLAGEKNARMQLNASIIWDLVLSIAETYMIVPGILQHVLMCIANLAYLQKLHPTIEQCRLLTRLIVPVYTEISVFEAWAVMLCNITGLHPETVQMLVQVGVVEVMERLVLYHGENGKTALRGIQSLANMAVGFTSGHFPVPLS